MRYALLCLSFIVLGCSPEEAADPTEQPVDTDTPPTTSTTTTTATTTTATTTPPADLIDNTYVIDISSGTWIQPAGVGFIIGSLLEQELLLGITDV